MRKAKKSSRPRVYLTKRRVASAAKRGIRRAARRAMVVMGYIVVVQDGWVVKKFPDGTIEKIEPLASQNETTAVNLD